MLVKTFGSVVFGVDAITITIEVNVTGGLHTFLVGSPDSVVKESVRRVESAIKHNGFQMPRTKLVINLAPADIRKSGAAFDLPIAMGILAATAQLPDAARLGKYIMVGELGLDGAIHPVRGILPISIKAKAEGFQGLIIPSCNAWEARALGGLDICPAGHLLDAIALFGGKTQLPASPGHIAMPIAPMVHRTPAFSADPANPLGLSPLDTAGSDPPADRDNMAIPVGRDDTPDLADVRGQDQLKRALEVAAAGNHNILLIGAPGSGKTMLARRMPGILPPLSFNEALETTKVHSVAGKLRDHLGLITQRPFRDPHHTISIAALAGGGPNPMPGEISLAHNGVLFLDEFPEFRREVLEIMRQPMEDGRISISRARAIVEFPARFLLLAAMNPCPCGYLNHPSKSCSCPPSAIRKYLNRISGPLLDRIDLQVEVRPVPFEKLTDTGDGEPSVKIRERVIRAREIQTARLGAGRTNAGLDTRQLREHCAIGREGQEMMRHAVNDLELSARAHDRILKVGRTIADLAGSEKISAEHLAEAIQYRSLDRQTNFLS